MPCVIGRWPTSALGFLGENNTCGLLHSACTSHSSMRLFFEGFCVALNQALTDDPTGDNPLVPRLIFGVGEDPALHPEGPFRISPPTIRALFRLEVPQVLEDEYRSFLLRGELHNASAHEMSDLGVYGADLAPEVGIVLFVLCDDASL